MGLVGPATTDPRGPLKEEFVGVAGAWSVLPEKPVKRKLRVASGRRG
jgi:hypothetical protein